MESIRVLLADDHTLFRQGIRTLLERMPGVEIVGDVATGEEAVALADGLVPDVVLMDIKMPGINGIEATSMMVRSNPHVGVILLTMLDDPEMVFAGMRAGARGYVLKEAEPDELMRAVEAASRGEVLLCPIIAAKVLEHMAHEQSLETVRELQLQEVTPRELEVLQLAAKGLSNKEIASRLNIAEKTAKNHIANIFSKLRVNDRTQAVLYAIQHGMVHLEPWGAEEHPISW